MPMLPGPGSRRSEPLGPSLGRHELNGVIAALAHAERLDATWPVEVTSAGSSGRVLSLARDTAAPPAGTAIDVRLTGFEATTGKYSWIEQIYNSSTMSYEDKVDGKVGTPADAWAVEINGRADCWDAGPNVRSYARIVPSEGFGFYRFYRVDRGSPPPPCPSRTLSVTLVWDDTRKQCTAHREFRITHHGSGVVVAAATDATPDQDAYLTADISAADLGPGDYDVHVKIPRGGDLNNAAFCVYDETITVLPADCAVNATIGVCCPRFYLTTRGCGPRGDATVTSDLDGTTAAVPWDSPALPPAFYDPNPLPPYPGSVTLHGSATSTGYDPTPLDLVSCFTCGGPSEPYVGCVPGTAGGTIGPFQADATHVCVCTDLPAPRTLFYSDVEGHSATLTYYDNPTGQTGSSGWWGIFLVDDSPNVTVDRQAALGADGTNHHCDPGTGAKAPVWVHLLCGRNQDGTVTWTIHKHFIECTQATDYNGGNIYLFAPATTPDFVGEVGRRGEGVTTTPGDVAIINLSFDSVQRVPPLDPVVETNYKVAHVFIPCVVTS